MGDAGNVGLFPFLFAVSGSKSLRQFYRAITNSLAHLAIQILEVITIGYTVTNYFAIGPIMAQMTNMGILATYQNINHQDRKRTNSD